VDEFSTSSSAAVVFGHGLFRELASFVETLPSRLVEIERLHSLRIASKRLRYAIEAAIEIWPDLAMAELVELLKSTQSQLGSLHDLVIRERRLIALNCCPLQRERTEPDAESRTSQTESFWKWWMAQPLERILANTTAEIISLMRPDQTE
jgi:CHAD domain-containing protein